MGEAEQKKPARSNRLVVLLMLALIFASLSIIIKGVFFPPSLEPPALRAQDLGPMDLNWRLKQLDGPDFDMAQLSGKVVFMNFWENWCGPCRAEMPSIERLRQKLEGTDVLVLPVFQDSPDDTRRFVQTHAITMPVYHVEGPLPPDITSGTYPTTYIIGRDGHFVFRQAGSVAWDDESVVAFLRELAAKGDGAVE